MFNSASSKAAMSRFKSVELASTTTSLLSLKGNPSRVSNSLALSGSSTTNRMIELSVVSSTVMASTWMLLDPNCRTRSWSRPRRLGVNTENWMTGSERRPFVVWVGIGGMDLTIAQGKRFVGALQSGRWRNFWRGKSGPKKGLPPRWFLRQDARVYRDEHGRIESAGSPVHRGVG